MAQTHRGAVRGTIYDPNGDVVAGATVTITNTGTGESRTATTGDQGEYAVSSLPPSLYKIKVEKTGFNLYENDVDLQVNQVVRADAYLTIGMVNIVSLDAQFDADLKKDSASLGAVINNRQVTGLPLDGRNFFELSLLVPGAVPPAQGSAGS